MPLPTIPRKDFEAYQEEEATRAAQAAAQAAPPEPAFEPLPLAPEGYTAEPMPFDTSAPPPQMEPIPNATGPAPVPQPIPNAPAQRYSPFDDVFRQYAGDLAGDPQFIAVVAAGTKAESGWNPNSRSGDAGHSWGLFQMHDKGAGAGMGEARLDPHAASAVMVPRYADGYRRGQAQGLSGPALASFAAAWAERPEGWDNPGSTARQNYGKHFAEITGGAYQGPSYQGGGGQPSPSPSPTSTGSGVPYSSGAAPLPVEPLPMLPEAELPPELAQYRQSRMSALTERYGDLVPHRPPLEPLPYGGGSEGFARSQAQVDALPTAPPVSRAPVAPSGPIVMPRPQPAPSTAPDEPLPVAPPNYLTDFLAQKEAMNDPANNPNASRAADYYGPTAINTTAPATVPPVTSRADDYYGPNAINTQAPNPQREPSPLERAGQIIGTGLHSLPGVGNVADNIGQGSSQLRDISPGSIVTRTVAGEEQIADETRPLFDAMQNAIRQYGPDSPEAQAAANAYNAAAANLRAEGVYNVAERNPNLLPTEFAANLATDTLAGTAPLRSVPGVGGRIARAALSPGQEAFNVAEGAAQGINAAQAASRAARAAENAPATSAGGFSRTAWEARQAEEAAASAAAEQATRDAQAAENAARAGRQWAPPRPDMEAVPNLPPRSTVPADQLPGQTIRDTRFVEGAPARPALNAPTINLPERMPLEMPGGSVIEQAGRPNLAQLPAPNVMANELDAMAEDAWRLGQEDRAANFRRAARDMRERPSAAPETPVTVGGLPSAEFDVLMDQVGNLHRVQDELAQTSYGSPRRVYLQDEVQKLQAELRAGDQERGRRGIDVPKLYDEVRSRLAETPPAAPRAPEPAVARERREVLPDELKDARDRFRRGELPIRDVYRETKAPTEVKGVRRESGDEIYGYAHSPDRFLISDATGRQIRKYVELPNGAVVHPDELTRFTVSKDGTVSIPQAEPLTAMREGKPLVRGRSFDSVLSNVAGYMGREQQDWPITIRSSGGTEITKTVREWREVERELTGGRPGGRIGSSFQEFADGVGGASPPAATAGETHLYAGLPLNQLNSVLSQAGYGAAAGAFGEQTSANAEGREATPGDIARGAAIGAVAGPLSARLGRQALRTGERAVGVGLGNAPGATEAGARASERAANVLLNKYPEEVQQIIRAAADANPAMMETARRGVIGDDVVKDLAQMAGSKTDDIVKRWKPGQTQNAETILAMREALARSARDVMSAQQAYRGADTTANLATLMEHITEHRAIQEAVTGVTAEAGRALRQFRQSVQGLDTPDKRLEALLKLARRKNSSKEDLAKFLQGVDLEDPESVARAAQVLHNPHVSDLAGWLLMNSLLSNPVGRLRDTLSSAAMTIGYPLEKAAAVPFDLAQTAILGGGRGARTVRMGEVKAEYAGMWEGLSNGWRDAWQVIQKGYTPAQLNTNLDIVNREPIHGPLAAVLGMPTRLVGANDAFFRAINTRGAASAIALRKAENEGLKGAVLADRAAELRADPATIDEAFTTTRYRILQEGGKVVDALRGIQRIPVLGKMVLPFAQTPVNLMRYAAERSPLGPALLLGEHAGAAIGVGTKPTRQHSAEMMGRATVGSLTMLGFWGLAQQGDLTGPAPQSDAERDAFYRQGKQPYAIRIGDQWHSYQAWGLAPLLAAGAISHQAMQRGDAADAHSAFAVGMLGIVKAMTDQPFMQGMSNLAQLADNPERRGLAYLESLARMPVPQALQWVGRATDPYIRDPGDTGSVLTDVGQSVTSAIPGLQGAAPVKRDAFGRAVERSEGQQGLRALDPSRPTMAKDDPVERELARLQLKDYAVQPGFVGKALTVGKDPGPTERVQLTQQERDTYQALAGQLTYVQLSAAIADPGWAAITDAQRAEFIDRTIRRTREYVAEDLRKDLGPRAIQQFYQREARRGG